MITLLNVFILYLLIIIGFIHFKGLSSTEAFKTVNGAIKAFFHQLYNIFYRVYTLLHEEDNSAPFIVNGELLKELIDAVCDISILDADLTRRQVGTYSKCHLPCIYIEFCPRSDSKDANALLKKLQNIMLKHFTENGIRNHRLRIFLKKLDNDTYSIHIVYSVTEQDIKKFDCLLLQVKAYKRRQALQVKKPVIDPKLEQALSKMDDRGDEDAKDDKA